MGCPKRGLKLRATQGGSPCAGAGEGDAYGLDLSHLFRGGLYGLNGNFFGMEGMDGMDGMTRGPAKGIVG